ncbi:MAG: NADH dehydrogenase subunit 5 [Alicyclobacillus sp.]|nr:NADH dehydrogenase subunit 5 [Alicyclobacillus sp.]
MHYSGWDVAWAMAWLAVLLNGTWLGLFPPATPRFQARLVRLHTGLLWLPVTISLAGWVFAAPLTAWGPWRLDRLGWFMSLYISLLNLLIQTFSVRYLQGDRAYPRYFGGLTWLTAAAAATWMSGHLALLAVGWTAMGLALTALVSLKREWAPARAVARLCGKTFFASSTAVAVAVVWLAHVSGSWQVDRALAQVSTFAPGARYGICGLLLLAALLQAGGWPFQRWLLESAVTPTPVSAVMHAGLVNAGGLLLTRMSPLLDQSGVGPHLVLLLLAWLSVVLGTGVMLVQTDYKRQLVASTMAQMGLMLTQCALGAYDAAVVHLVLHGLFKATLFLRAGSVVPRPERASLGPAASLPSAADRRLHVGLLLACLLGAAYWLIAPAEPARALSGLFLGAGWVLTWRQLATVREGRWLGLGGMVFAVLVAEGLRMRLSALVQAALQTSHPTQPGWPVSPDPAAAHVLVGVSGGPAGFPGLVLAATAWLLYACGAGVFAWCLARPTSPCSIRLYLGLVHLGEPRPQALEAHPRYLANYAEEATLS